MCHHHEIRAAYWRKLEEAETPNDAEEPAEPMETPAVEPPDIEEPEIEQPEIADD